MRKPDGGPAFARPFFENTNGTEWSRQQDGMSLRAYLAAHAPVDMDAAYKVWAGGRPTNNPDEEGYRDSHMVWGLGEETSRAAFFRFWAAMRAEFADAVIAELEANAE